MKGTTVVTLMAFTVGVLLALGALVTVYFKFSEFTDSKCWADAKKEVENIQKIMASLRPDQSNFHFMELGNCVQLLIFIDQPDFFQFFRKSGINIEGPSHLECPKNYTSMIGLIPKHKDATSLKDALLASTGGDFNMLAQWAKEYAKIGGKSFCKNIPCKECEFAEEFSIQGAEEPKNYCLKIHRLSKVQYQVSDLGPAQTKEECQTLFNIDTGDI